MSGYHGNQLSVMGVMCNVVSFLFAHYNFTKKRCEEIHCCLLTCFSLIFTLLIKYFMHANLCSNSSYHL